MMEETSTDEAENPPPETDSTNRWGKAPHKRGTPAPGPSETVVQKYGGSSVATPESVRKVAERVVRTRAQGHRVVVVVSAMGDTTNELLSLARELAPDPPRRELDILLSSGERISSSLLSMAIQDLGVDAVALTGPQSGVVTTDEHFNASIVEVRPDRVMEELEAGRVVVAAGYQGKSHSGEVTTLGRGGSDTTAVALAAAVGADRCELCSDVRGVLTADPRIVPSALPITALDYDDMVTLSRHGAAVLNRAAVSLAREMGVLLEARASFDDAAGTLIGSQSAGDGEKVVGVACHRDLLRIRCLSEQGVSGDLLGDILECLGVDEPFLELPAEPGKGHEILVPSEETANGSGGLEALADELSGAIQIDDSAASVSVVGQGLADAPQLLAPAQSRLAGFGIRAHDPAHASGRSRTWLVEPAALADAACLFHQELIERPRGEAVA